MGASPTIPRVLVVDDEEAILETMTFTFMDVYEVLTSTDAHRALEILDENAPVAVVITDQRMPEMTGVEFLKQVVERHPETVRIMLTGFADSEATVQAINEGHVYAYINKPWEPEQLKQVVKRAVEHHKLSAENERLVEDLQRANRFLEAVMDRLGTGALAVDADGVVQATNRPARQMLHLAADPRGRALDGLLSSDGLSEIRDTLACLAAEESQSFGDVDLATDGSVLRVRVSTENLSVADDESTTLGRVILLKEVSHEPLRRRFYEIIDEIASHDDDLRRRLEESLESMQKLHQCVTGIGITSPGMAELSERVSRAQTAVQNWLDVDDQLAREDYPDAQTLLDRMRVASQRWPQEDVPSRVRALATRVDAYYESGENPKKRVL